MIDWEQRLPTSRMTKHGWTVGVTSFEQGYIIGMREALAEGLETAFGPLGKREIDVLLSLDIGELRTFARKFAKGIPLRELDFGD